MNFFAVQISLLASRLHLQRNWQLFESTDSHGITKAKMETGNNMQMLVQVDRGWTGHKSDTVAGKTKSKPKVGGATAPYGLIPRRLFSNNFQCFLPNIISRSYGPGWKWFPPHSTGPVTPSCGSALNRTGGGGGSRRKGGSCQTKPRTPAEMVGRVDTEICSNKSQPLGSQSL